MLCLMLWACTSGPHGSVLAIAVLPPDLDPTRAAPEADVIVYLRDLAPIDGVTPGPWDAPVVSVQRVPVRSVTGKEVSFTFDAVPVGEYALFVMIDTGRPHVRRGADSFPPRPGDYHGRTVNGVIVRQGQTSPVRVEARIQVLAPEGYDAPRYLD